MQSIHILRIKKLKLTHQIKIKIQGNQMSKPFEGKHLRYLNNVGRSSRYMDLYYS